MTVIVYDVTSAASFAAVDQWVADVREERGESLEDVLLVLVGNKADCDTQPDSGERQVSVAEGEGKAAELGFKVFMETSAKSGANVKALFTRVAQTLPLISPPPDSASAMAGQGSGGKIAGSQLIDVRLGEQSLSGAKRCAC